MSSNKVYLMALLGLVLAQNQSIAEEIPKHVVEERSRFPYQVSLLVKNTPKCSAAILDQTNLLTAAQCVTDEAGNRLEASTLEAIVGDVIVDGNSSSSIRVPIRDFIVHENFIRPNFANDIAILWIDPLTFNQNIKMVPISSTTPSIDERCGVAGWGPSSHGGPHSRKLGYMHAVIAERRQCEDHFHHIFQPEMICGSGQDADVCDGDEGAALVCDGAQVGIVSRPQGCVGTPSIYTSVPHFFVWIQTHQKRVLCRTFKKNNPKRDSGSAQMNVQFLLILCILITVLIF